ncbi:MAG: 3'-5' exonuclease, partial [Proteobacteria bacterium]|nr:3'-5' exonuclease [Pseudomonadota bacterium]
LDFEATDKDVATARIIQVAFSLYDTDTKKEVYHYSSLILPEGEFEIDPVAGAITGITKEQLTKYGIALDEALNVLLRSLVGVDFLAAHNLHNYDLPLLKNEVERLRQEEVQLPKLVDTRFDIPWPEHIETRKLTYLAAEFGIVNPSAHSARHDVDLMMKLFGMFPLETIMERAASPQVWVRANVSYDQREKAKARKFLWDGGNKWWVKLFKQCDFEKETFEFPTMILKDYKGP